MENARRPACPALAPARALPVLRGLLHADVAVVGGGLTGLTAALLLQRAGRSVVVLEAQRLAEGVSGHSSVHLTEALARYRSVSLDWGKDAAAVVAESSRAALEEIHGLAATLAPHCNFSWVSGYLYAETFDQAEELLEECEAAREAGLDASMTTDAVALGGRPARGVVPRRPARLPPVRGEAEGRRVRHRRDHGQAHPRRPGPEPAGGGEAATDPRGGRVPVHDEGREIQAT